MKNDRSFAKHERTIRPYRDLIGMDIDDLDGYHDSLLTCIELSENAVDALPYRQEEDRVRQFLGHYRWAQTCQKV